MKKRIYIAALLVMLCVAASLNGHSDEFVLGAYSGLRSHYEGSDDPPENSTFNNQLSDLLEQAGFNSVRATAVYNPDPTLVTDLASTLNDHNLDLILEDHIFVPGDQYGYSALSTGVNLKFEAEYDSAGSVNTGDQLSDTYFYKSVGRTGSIQDDDNYSNWYYWSVLADDGPGWAYKDLLYRWPTDDDEYYRVGPEFHFLRSAEFGGNPIGTDDNCLYVKFVFKVTELDSLQDDVTLATFSFTCFADPTTVLLDEADYPNILYDPDIDEDCLEYIDVWFNCGTDTNFISEKSLTKADYELLPQAAEHDDPDVKEICFTFPLELQGEHSLLGQGVVKATAWYWQLKNLNPRMWWHGNGRLMLDYVEFSDKIFNEFTNDPNELARLRNFEYVSNLSHHFGVDEPKHPHYRAYEKLEEHLVAQGGKELLTASSFEKRQVAKPDGTPLRLTQAYIDEVNPRALMIYSWQCLTWR
jgi:hypothetical protein